jgi:hypothetical protein
MNEYNNINLTDLNLKKNINLEDIVLCDSKIYAYWYNPELKKTVKNSSCYNVGDILNMPHLSGVWPEKIYLSKKIKTDDIIYDETIINLYEKNKPDDEIVPNIPRIINSVNEFTEKYKQHYINIYNFVKNPKCMCVHVRSGDKDVLTDHFINVIYDFSQKFDYIILLSGVHSATYAKSHDEKVNNFFIDINKILNLNSNIYIYLDIPDVHLSIMMNASNLLLHCGGFSAVASIISTGNLYITKKFNHAFSENWIKKVNKKYILV